MGRWRGKYTLPALENVDIDVLVCSTVNSLNIWKSKSCIVKSFMNLVFDIVFSVIVSKEKSPSASSYYKYYAVHDELENYPKHLIFIVFRILES